MIHALFKWIVNTVQDYTPLNGALVAWLTLGLLLLGQLIGLVWGASKITSKLGYVKDGQDEMKKSMQKLESTDQRIFRYISNLDARVSVVEDRTGVRRGTPSE